MKCYKCNKGIWFWQKRKFQVHCKCYIDIAEIFSFQDIDFMKEFKEACLEMEKQIQESFALPSKAFDIETRGQGK